MKISSTLVKIIVSLVIFVIPLTVFSNASYKGKIVYNNSFKTPLEGVTVLLKDAEGNILQSALTNEDGDYQFRNIPNNIYYLDIDYDREVGGVDLRDLNKIINHLIGAKELKGLSLLAADVDDDGVIDWGDYWYFLIDWFLSGKDFEGDDWVFQTRMIDLSSPEFKSTGVDYTVNRGAIDPGDYEPGDDQKSKEYDVRLKYKGVINSSDDKATIPVSFDGQMNIRGGALIFDYSNNIFIEDVTSDIQGFEYSLTNGKLKVSWMNVESKSNVNKPLFVVHTRLYDSNVKEELFSLNTESQLIDTNGELVFNETISMPEVVNDTKATLLYDIFPNPVKDYGFINYEIGEDSNVKIIIYNTNGQKVAELVNEYQTQGAYQVKVDKNSLNLVSGAYIYKLECSGNYSFTDSKILIVN